MSKTKKPPKSPTIPKLATKSAEPVAAHHAPWFRETVESIVIAFVLAFLFRTFEAEAFVIPTGSMAPTLMGQHKDVYCTECGQRFKVNASIDETQSPTAFACVAGTCPNCRYTMPMATNLPSAVWEYYPAPDVRNHRSYNGDRILVNKYIYTIADPERWDVVVFHFPGDAQMNYIKRLVGLPGETLRIFQGDLFVKNGKGGSDGNFHIRQKPPGTLLAMRQLVHDTTYDPASLYTAGWPLRWGAADANRGAWKLDAKVSGKDVAQRFTVDNDDELEWIRYRNVVPDFDVWGELLRDRKQANPKDAAGLKLSIADRARPHLVMDFNAYNTRVMARDVAMRGSLAPIDRSLGLHWVGDLMVVADVDVEEARGELVLDLVEGGQHFKCAINLADGVAKLSAGVVADYSPMAKTILKEPGKYRVGLANFDDQLRLFVKERSLLMPDFRAGDAVTFDQDTAYDVDQVFGARNQILPKTSEEDSGDLAPVGIGARNAKLAVTRLQVWRDIYYIADSSQTHQLGWPITDLDLRGMSEQQLVALAYDPSLWPTFQSRREVKFELGADQFFVMGDNSPESSDARLWRGENGRGGGRPGGDYLERRLLIGKALCVYWPHSWNRIPGTPIPFPLFPNFADMRIVR